MRRIKFQQNYLCATLPVTLYRNEVLLSMVGYACGAFVPPRRPAFLPYTSHFGAKYVRYDSNTYAGPGEVRLQLSFRDLGNISICIFSLQISNQMIRLSLSRTEKVLSPAE